MATLSMSNKKLFTADYEIHASIKMLYPYIQTASGLSEWFADDVTINNEESVYIKILDYSDFDDLKELKDLWESLIEALRKTVGG